MHLAVNPPVLPMLAKRVEKMPEAGDWIFEPKWDGFRVRYSATWRTFAAGAGIVSRKPALLNNLK